ncbi:hypothetical protein [Pectobacterium aroidearum]|uniref:hypothetical protein n=1 Tax=Pectobacterium aroidearum TaxID=1201031 RepID=UPI0021147CEA|nr:hypothetical protein [Pectobacterium aroidearum]UUE56738.1 hypothetical protein L0Y27_16270 [Pectobacterium aroidearum]UUE69445.1 hypothetical protein L0Y21_17160 [Pectobacterium aroidearum]UUE73817.1 hypothetical protein L0Y20_17265 [Pectobacterium aroidearum]UUE78151.1 hypothetical protein L0Y24_16705 [Pectobacterium aroidearum]
MDKKQNITILLNGEKKNATFYLSKAPPCLIKFFIDDALMAEVDGDDFFSCLCKLRIIFKDITFLCKGAKKNVYPTRMARQMAYGIKGYEFELGRHATRHDLVGIFDYEDRDLVTPDEQREYFQEWLHSFN